MGSETKVKRLRVFGYDREYRVENVREDTNGRFVEYVAHERVVAKLEAELAEAGVTERTLRSGLLELGNAIERRSMKVIRDTWGGNTPEDWCYQADALSGLLEENAKLRKALEEKP